MCTALGGCSPVYVQVGSGTNIMPVARPALAEDGSVIVAEPDRLQVSNGLGTSVIDLTALGLVLPAEAYAKRLTQIRRAPGGSGGDVVFVADRPQANGCATGQKARGAYRIAPTGGTLTTLFEACMDGLNAEVGHAIGMSPNGTVAFSQITNGHGALYRGPSTGPVTGLQSGAGSGVYNTGGVDIDDAGRAVVQTEYSDPNLGMLMRGILAFDTPGQAIASLDTAIEKLGIGSQPQPSINSSGVVAFSLNRAATVLVGGSWYTFAEGAYTAVPTLMNTPKSLTVIADLSGDYCRIGNVDINDAGTVVFEATLRSAGGACGSAFDGIFTGPRATSQVVGRGEPKLQSHQNFDDIVLGEINDKGQVSFTTECTAATAEPVKVWRTGL